MPLAALLLIILCSLPGSLTQVLLSLLDPRKWVGFHQIQATPLSNADLEGVLLLGDTGPLLFKSHLHFLHFSLRIYHPTLLPSTLPTFQWNAVESLILTKARLLIL